MDRRSFVLASTAALAACSSSNAAFAPGSLASSGRRAIGKLKVQQRLEITEFSANPKLVAALRAGVAAMRAVKNPRDVTGWRYWHYSHWMPESNPPADMIAVWDQCKHAQSYFQPWHRGFLHFFEIQLRAASGNPSLTLPYWDYYKNPKLPAIFTDPTLRNGAPNPLYRAGRKNSAVDGLNYLAFAKSVTTFPWGPGETFEDLCERNPHNRVHDQVGGAMGSVPTAPDDPIFWAHHCNVDRLWSAWLAAGGGRAMPPPDSLWAQERFAYNLGGSWNARVSDMYDTRALGYSYADLSLPVAPANAALPARPPVKTNGVANGAGPLHLTLEPITVAIPLDGRLRNGGSFDIVLDGVSLSELGKGGGFDYGVYVNLPQTRTPISELAAFEIGEFGSFALSMPSMPGMNATPGAAKTLRLAANGAIVRQANAGAPRKQTLMLSFVPYGAPSGVARGAELASIKHIDVVPS
jgi:tyrosinase